MNYPSGAPRRARELFICACVRACTCLLGGDQAVLGRAEDAADEAELVHGELGSLGDLLLLQQAADGQTAAAAARPAEGEPGRERPRRRRVKNTVGEGGGAEKSSDQDFVAVQFLGDAPAEKKPFI